jgi:hypothetical protein
MIPKKSIIDWGSLFSWGNVWAGKLAKRCLAQSKTAKVDNVVLAVGNHLIGNLDEKTSHSLVGVVVASDGVDHLYWVHEGRKSFLDCLRGAFVEGLDEFLKSLKVFDIVFGFVESLSDTKLDAGPLAGSKMELVLGSVCAVTGTSGSRSKDIEDLNAVLGGKLFRNAGKLSHALFPVFKFLTGSCLFVVLLLGLSLFKSLLDFLRPLVEDLFKVVDHIGVYGFCVSCYATLGWLKSLSIFLPLGGIRVEDDVGL